MPISTDNSSSTFPVKSSSVSGHVRRVSLLLPSGKTTDIRVHRFALVGRDDKVFLDPQRAGHVYVLSTEDSSDKIQVLPHFETNEQLRLGNATFDLMIKEVTHAKDLEAYEFLEGFHYRTSTAVLAEREDFSDGIGRKDLGGRRVVLMCYLRVGRNWEPVGYVELQMPLLMVKPRHLLFNRPFSHPTRPVCWESWDLTALKDHVNLIVRIARVVTSPEFRGIGLARILVLKAKEFACKRWHIKGRRPLFIEISAEMLKYLDFVSTAGLRFVGDTEGNLERVNSDLQHMQKGYVISSGIMSLQKKYLTKLKEVSAKSGRDFEKVLAELREITASGDKAEVRARLNALPPTDWYLFREVLRFPIPYHIGGLDAPAQEFIDSYQAAPSRLTPASALDATNVRLDLRDITITATYVIPDTAHVRAIRDCFGINGETLTSKLLGPVSIEASAGNIVMVTGSNGSGKSLLLKSIDPNFAESDITVRYRSHGASAYEVAWMEEIHSEEPLIEYFSKKWGIESSISALNRAGLSEAFVYLKPYKLLSRGQQYRARLAELGLHDQPVWLIDEFCADLDEITAKIVASNLRKQVIKYGRIAIIAAANHSHYLDVLRPTKVVVLRHNSSAKVISYTEYRDELYHQAD